MTIRHDIFLRLDEPELQRIWSRVDVRSAGECWHWTGGKAKADNRGRIKLEGIWFVAPRLVLAIDSGFYPSADIFACHKCDNPPCCNPAHLWWGSAIDNNADAVRKGRMHKWHGQRAGHLNPNARLQPNDVIQIRADQRSYAEISAQYGVGQTSISFIKNRVRWSEL